MFNRFCLVFCICSLDDKKTMQKQKNTHIKINILLTIGFVLSLSLIVNYFLAAQMRQTIGTI